MKRTGFTLLELVISCAILVTVFAFAATALTRVHRLRIESESQTRLMTEGRALLDELADELAHVAGTNLWVANAVTSGGHPESQSLACVRYATHPASRANGDAYAALPFFFHSRDFSFDDAVTAERSRGAVEEDAILYSNAARRIVYDVRSDGSTSVTNAYAADEMGTHIPAAGKGETISVPFTTGSSVTTYGSRTSYSGTFTVVPSGHEGTNTVLVTASFNTSHSGERTVAMRRPAAVAWPEPSTLRATARAEAMVTAEPVADTGNVSTNAFLVPGFLEYTNAPVSTATFTDAETNATVRTDLGASIEGSMQEATNSPPAVGQLLYGPQEGTIVMDGYWTWGEAAPANTNGILSGVSLVLNGGRTNTYASAADVAAMATGAVTRADANFQFSEILDFLTLDFAPPTSDGTNDVNEASSTTEGEPSVTDPEPSATDPGPSATNPELSATDLEPSATNAPLFSTDARLYAILTNLVSVAAPIAVTNEFAPVDAAGAALPVYVSEVLAYEERATPLDFASAFSVRSAVAGADTNVPPLAAQGYRRQLNLGIERVVTGTNLSLRVVHDWTADTFYSLRFDVPAALVPTNGNARTYGGVVTNVFPKGTSYDSETQWHDIVLEEDFQGSDERTAGIWLRVEGDRDKSELVAREEIARLPYAKAGNKQWPDRDTLHPRAWQALHSVVVTPLCFSTNENERLDLIVWDPRDDPPGPPVCADIYVELLAPAHRLRADKMPEGEKRDKYIQDHVIRLTRRAPVGTARRTLP